jgi:transposase-like protein
MIGLRADGRNQLVRQADGVRESTESLADLLRDCRRRGMTAPVLAACDGALGFWKAYAKCFRPPAYSGAGGITPMSGLCRPAEGLCWSRG